MKKILFCIAISLSGCSAPLGHFSVVSDRNVNDLDQMAPTVGDKNTRVKGESCRDYILFFPITSRQIVADALDEAIRKTPDANALKDVTLKSDGLFTLLFNQKCYAVEGTPVKLGK